MEIEFYQKQYAICQSSSIRNDKIMKKLIPQLLSNKQIESRQGKNLHGDSKQTSIYNNTEILRGYYLTRQVFFFFFFNNCQLLPLEYFTTTDNKRNICTHLSIVRQTHACPFTFVYNNLKEFVLVNESIVFLQNTCQQFACWIFLSPIGRGLDHVIAWAERWLASFNAARVI